MTKRHTRWKRTGADEHAAAYEEARAALLLGQMVHDRRIELAMTQADLAERAGMTQPQLSRLECRHDNGQAAEAAGLVTFSPPKTPAGARTDTIPDAIRRDVRAHLADRTG